MVLVFGCFLTHFNDTSTFIVEFIVIVAFTLLLSFRFPFGHILVTRLSFVYFVLFIECSVFLTSVQ